MQFAGENRDYINTEDLFPLPTTVNTGSKLKIRRNKVK